MISKGQLLLSEPFMLDPNFKRSVVLLTDHEEEGSIGFVLNQKSNYKITDLLDDIGEFDADVYIGGPVSTNTLHFLHSVGDLIEESIPVCRGIWWSGDFDAMKFLILQGVIKQDNIRFYLGYSGWSEGQLQEELNEKAWIVEPMDPNYLFKKDPDQLWKEVMNSKGHTFSALSQLDGDHIFN
ncbi:MAG: YqgE/AlgH family protein [Saprospiraceae bacterium]|nr:YqgE/AlgH family protein [Saprospiraceae bacterium]